MVQLIVVMTDTAIRVENLGKRYPSTMRLVSLSNHRAGVAVADWFHAPEVDEVDVSGYKGTVGDAIVIRAGDDFDRR